MVPLHLLRDDRLYRLTVRLLPKVSLPNDSWRWWSSKHSECLWFSYDSYTLVQINWLDGWFYSQEVILLWSRSPRYSSFGKSVWVHQVSRTTSVFRTHFISRNLIWSPTALLLLTFSYRDLPVGLQINFLSLRKLHTILRKYAAVVLNVKNVQDEISPRRIGGVYYSQRGQHD